jgi:hypothetical protein
MISFAALLQAHIYHHLADRRIDHELFEKNKARYDKELSDIRRQLLSLDDADKHFYMNATYCWLCWKTQKNCLRLRKLIKNAS